jgi:hypothetical protein
MRAFPTNPAVAVRTVAAFVLSLTLPLGAGAQTGELNLLTDLNTPFPPGCLSIDIPAQPASAENLLVDQLVLMPSINSSSRDQPVEVQMWRVACADEGFSVVVVRLDPVNNNALVLVPQLFAGAGDVQNPFHEAQLIKLPGSGNLGASGSILPVSGSTWMLGVNPVSIDLSTVFLFTEYNDQFTLELNWGSYSTAQPEAVRFLLDQFEPTLDPPQFDQPVLNGRYTGQWVLDGAPRQGLVLQIAERISDNFVFAIFFTSLDGQPLWVVGNSTPAVVTPGPVSIAMATLENGAFITDPNQPPREDVIASNAGTISILPLNCNQIRVNYDFSPLGHGSGTMDLDRLVRIAGHDCNPWADVPE